MAVKTYSFRYRPTTAPSGTEDRVLACSHTTDACHCVINSSGQIGYYVSGSFAQLGTKTQTIDNIWHSYIVEKDELGNGCIYVDGQKIGCATNFPIDNVNQIGNFKTELKPEVGRKPKVGLKPRNVSNIYTRPCCGDIDEIAYFDRQLSASEIVDLAQSGSLSKVYTLADYKITAMADDNIIATTEKPRYAENWRSIWDADQRTTALPTAIGSIAVNGSYKSLANAANSAGVWNPTTSGTAAYDYYQAVENWRQMYFVSSGGGTGFLLTSQLSVDTDISAMSPTLEARQSALMYAEDALRSAIMTQRQSNAETNAIDTMTEYADDLEAALRLQTDHALVFTTSATDPSTSWTAEQKLIHKGDYWRVNTSSPWKTWSGSAWGTVDDAQAQAAASAAASAASTAQSTANNAASVASSAQSTANTASSNATTALNTLSDIASDSKFTPVEKQSALNEWNIIAAEKPVNVAQATSFGVSYTDYASAFQALANYLNNGATWSSGTPAWLASLTTTQTIVGTDFRAAWKLYYDKRTDLLNAIAAKAKALADDAQDTADKKTTLWATLAVANSGGAVAGDMFMDSSLIYRCLTSAPGITVANSTRITSKNFGNLASAPTGAIANDRYYNTNNLTWYRYTGSAWTADGEALNTVTVTYTPKYLGRYEGVHPASYNNGDWWLVYDTDDSPIVRGFWYSNNGTPARVSLLSAEAQRKYKGVGLEDVLYASNNGYALLSGAYNPVAVYGVTTMDLLAVNQAFIKKLVTQQLQFQEYVASIAGNTLVPRSGSTPGTQQIYMGKNPRYPDDASRAYEFALQEYLGMDGTKEVWMKHFWTRILASGVAALTLTGCVQANDGLQSRPGVVWKELADPFGASTVRDIAYGDGKWVAVGSDGKIAYSTDGQTFTLGNSPFGASTVYGVAYGNGKWVAVGYNGKIAYSTNGQTFTLGNSPFGASGVQNIAYGNGKWVAVGDYGKIAYSTNGQTFTLGNSPFGANYVFDIAYGNGKWVAVGDNGKIAYSTDGQTFVLGTSPFGTSTVYGISYGNGKWVAVGFFGKIAYSTDGQTFTLGTSPFGTSTVHSTAYGNGKWVAVGQAGKIAYSADGIVFGSNNLQQPFGSSGWLEGVACNEDGVFIAVGYLDGGSGGIIIRSDPLEAGGGVVGKVYDTARGELNKLWDGRYFPSYASVDEIAPKKYFRFPAGTAYTTIYNAVSPYMPVYNKDGRGAVGVASIGSYGHRSVNFVYRPNSTDLAFAEYGTEWLRISATVSGTTPYELKVEFIPDA